MYYNEFKEVLQLILQGTIDKNEILNYLIEKIDCELIYNTDDRLLSDIYFSLKHYATGEEMISKEEWMYFMDCLEGKRKFNFDEKMKKLSSKKM
jgi:hypothetical protein